MAKRRIKSEQTKKIILAGLLLAMAVLFVYQFMGGSTPNDTSNSNSSAAKPAKQRPPSGPQARRPTNKAERDEWVQAQLADITPLNLKAISHDGTSAVPGDRGNIFAQYVPPPPPPPKPPDPPPISLQAVQPQRNVVAGSPFKVPVIVRGSKFPADAQIFFESSPKPTTRMNDSQLKTEMEPGEYAYARSINVTVKSQSDPVTFYSNSVSFSIPNAPEPRFIYRGRHGTVLAAVELPGPRVPEYKLFKRGDEIQGVWRVDSIEEKQLIITHKQFEIRRALQMAQARP